MVNDVSNTTPDAAAVPPTANRPGMLRTVMGSPRGAIAISFLVLIGLASLLAPWIAPHDPLAQDLYHSLEMPSTAYWLGTDVLGRDLFSRILYAGRGSLSVVLVAVVVLVIIAIPVGLIAGYAGGFLDNLLMRISEIFQSVPTIIILLSVLALFARNMTAAMVALGVLASASLARLVRGTTLVVRDDLYITAAQLMGLSRFKVVSRHVLPRCRGVIIATVSLFAAQALGAQTGLNFLGVGSPPPNPTWGGMIAEGVTYFTRQAWLLVPPGVVFALTVLSFGLLGDTIRDVGADKLTGSANKKAARRRQPDKNDVLARSAAAVPAVDKQSPSTSAPLLSVQGLSLEVVGDTTPVRLLDGVSFEIAPGEIVGLVGESGSGKTMTARAIMGLQPNGLQITSGEIIFDGVRLDTLAQRDLRPFRGRRIAMVSQEPMRALDPCYQVGSLLAEVIRAVDNIMGKAVTARVLELLAMVELPDPEAVAKRYPHQISGGMAQRVAIAMALAGRPELLIADEATTALDVTVQAEILDLLFALQRQSPMAVLLVTHDLGVVANVCSKVVVMYAGQVVEVADVKQFFSAPAHPYSLALLRSSPERATVGEPLRAIPGTVPPPALWPASCRFAGRCEFTLPECTKDAIPLLALPGERRSRCIRTDELLAGKLAVR